MPRWNHLCLTVEGVAVLTLYGIGFMNYYYIPFTRHKEILDKLNDVDERMKQIENKTDNKFYE